MINIPLPSDHIQRVWDHLQKRYEEMLEKVRPTEDVSATVYFLEAPKFKSKVLDMPAQTCLS